MQLRGALPRGITCDTEKPLTVGDAQPYSTSSRQVAVPEQAESEGDETSRPANPQPKQDMHHTAPASRILPPRAKPATMGQQRFWRAIVPKPFCVLREGKKPRPLSYDVAAANQFSHTLEELTEGSGLSTDVIHTFSRMVHEAGLQNRIELLNTTTLDVGQGVYRVVFVPININMEEQPLAFGQHPEEARGSVWSYVAAHRTDQEGLRGMLLAVAILAQVSARRGK